MSTQQAWPGRVYVVDADPEFARSVASLAASLQLASSVFHTAADFLEHFDPDQPGCLVLDFPLPDLSGLDLLAQLRNAGRQVPVIFATANSDVPLAVAVMKLGALDFFRKPCSGSALLQALEQGILASIRGLQERRQRSSVNGMLATLSEREREISARLAQGADTRQVAGALGISEKTVEYHRTRLFRKLGVRNVVEMAYFVLHGRPLQQS